MSIKPCSDGNNAEDQHQDEITAEHNHQNDSDDTCPITCICNCCGISITYEPIQTFELVVNNIPKRQDLQLKCLFYLLD